MLTLQIAVGVALGILVAFYAIKNQGKLRGLLWKTLVYGLLILAFIANFYYLYFLSDAMSIGETFSKELEEKNYFVIVFTALLLLGIVIKLGEYLSYLIHGKRDKVELGFFVSLAYGIINLDIAGAIYWISYKLTSSENQTLIFLIVIYAIPTIFRYIEEKNS